MLYLDIFICHNDPSDAQGAFLHTASKPLSEIELMQFLYTCGYWRATIIAIQDLGQGFTRILFTNVTVQQTVQPETHRTTPSWPAPLTSPGTNMPFFEVPSHIPDDDCVIGFGIPLQEVNEFFASADGILYRDPRGLDLPETTAALRISESTDLAHFDRILIYTDGSSHAQDVHRPPIWNAERGRADTWSFVIVGECFQSPEHHIIEVIGWSTQEVH